MGTYTVRRGTLSLCIGYFLAETTLLALVVTMLIIWREEPAYIDWPIAIASWLACFLFSTACFSQALFMPCAWRTGTSSTTRFAKNKTLSYFGHSKGTARRTLGCKNHRRWQQKAILRENDRQKLRPLYG